MEEPDRIADVDSFAKLAKDVHGFDALTKLGPILRLLGRPGREAADALARVPAVAGQLQELRTLPDRFNALFVSRGWIAYESLDADIMQQAVRLGNAGQLDEAEQVLVNFYSDSAIRVRLQWNTGLQPFRRRRRLLDLALADYVAERYHACIPVVLAQLDGISMTSRSRASFPKGLS